MAGLHSLRLVRPGASDLVLCLTDADSSPAVILAIKTLVRHARSGVNLRLVDVRSGAIVATAKHEGAR